MLQENTDLSMTELGEVRSGRFWHQAAFHNIMAVELLIKAAVIFERGSDYEGLPSAPRCR